MKIDQGSRCFSEHWSERTGDKSEFSHRQSPFVREGWLLVRDLPGKLTDTLLSGVRCRMLPPSTLPKTQPAKPQKVNWLLVLPTPVYAIIASFLPLPPWINALVILGVAAGSFYLALKRSSTQNVPEQAATVQATAVQEIEDIAIHSALELSQETLTAWLDYLHGIEEDAKRGHDVTKDRNFGQWVQKFFVFASRQAEDRNIQMLKNELIDVLDNMGITVYEDLELNEEGVPSLPDETYYTDEREGEAFTQVKRPVVYSRRKLLAQGKIK